MAGLVASPPPVTSDVSFLFSLLCSPIIPVGHSGGAGGRCQGRRERYLRRGELEITVHVRPGTSIIKDFRRQQKKQHQTHESTAVRTLSPISLAATPFPSKNDFAAALRL